MNIYETRTYLPPAEVIERARSFFIPTSSPYSTTAEAVGEDCLRLHIDLAVIVIGATRQGDSTCIRGSASRGAHLLTEFFATFGSPVNVKQTAHRYGAHRTRTPLAETFAPAPVNGSLLSPEHSAPSAAQAA